MPQKNKSQAKLLNKDPSKWLAKKLFWILAVPIFMFLEYETQMKPYIVENYGLYLMGFIDGGLLITAVIIILLLALSELNSILSN